MKMKMMMIMMMTEHPSFCQHLLRLPRLLWLLVMLPMVVIAETDWSEELNAIQQRQTDGNVVQAVNDLEALHSQNPGASRLKLELAFLYLQLDQPEKAEDYLSEVLADPDLPVRVRINTQILLLQAQEAQAVSDYQFNSYLEISTGLTDQTATRYGQIGGRGQLVFPKTVFYSTRQSFTLRPLAQVTAFSRYYPDRPDTPWLGRLEGGFSLRNPVSILQLTFGLQHDDTLDGWLGRASYLRSFGNVRLRLGHEQFWHDQGLYRQSDVSLSTTLGSRSRLSIFWAGDQLKLDGKTIDDHDVGIGLNSGLSDWEMEINLIQKLNSDRLALENRIIWHASSNWRLRLRVDLTDLVASDTLPYAASISLRWTP